VQIVVCANTDSVEKNVNIYNISQNQLEYAPGVILVKFKNTIDLIKESNNKIKINNKQINEIFNDIGVKSQKSLFNDFGQGKYKEIALRNGLDRLLILQVNPEKNLTDINNLLNNNLDIEYAETDYYAQFASSPASIVSGGTNTSSIAYTITLSDLIDASVTNKDAENILMIGTNDPRYAEQWGLSKIEIEGAWNQTYGSPSVVIAIIDSGIDLDHPDLIPNLWTNPGEIPSNGLDDDNNGYVDDIEGWNFVNGTSDLMDDNGHGSLVAGIAAAKTGNAIGIAGVCGNCRIMPIKVMQSSGIANYSDIAAGINYAASKGAKVINLSLGGYANSQAVRDAVNATIAQNIVIIAGTGNDNLSTPFYPAAYTNVIAVAGTTSSDTRVSSSNYGTWVDVTAPGENILTTALGSDYVATSGTSMASPFVAGLAGLLLSINPSWTPALVASQLSHTADNIDSLNPGFEGMLGAGRINATTAIEPPQPILSYISYTTNGVLNGKPDFNSDVDLLVSIHNDWADATGISGTLSTSDSNIAFTTSNANYGDILSGMNGSNTIPYQFHIAPGAGYNHTIPFTLQITANGGTYTTSLDFTVTTRSSEIFVSGTIGENTTWISDNTYILTNNIGIAPSFTLTIQPGTVIKVNGDYAINVGGTLIADGTNDQPITFMPYTNGSTWNRIYIDDSSTDAVADSEGNYISGNILHHVNITNASSGIVCNSATVYLASISTNTGGMNCPLGATPLWILDSAFTGNTSATGQPSQVKRTNILYGTLTVNISSMIKDSTAGNISAGSGSTITNTGGGSLVISGSGNVSLSLFIGNVNLNSGLVENTNITDGNLSISGTGTITGNTIIRGGITCGSGCTISGNNIDDSPANSIYTSGSATISGNRIMGSVGHGIVSPAGTIEGNLIAHTTGDGLQTGAATIRFNTFIGIAGNAIYLNGGVPIQLQYNNFEFNTGTYDINNNNLFGVDVTASNNWWGTSDTEVIVERIYDYYNDYVLSKVFYSPILISPDETAPAFVRGVTLDPPSPVGIQTVNFTVQFSRPMDTLLNPHIAFGPTLNNIWTSKSRIPTARAQLGVTSGNDDKIYAIGGYDSSGALSTVEEYDPVTNTWTTIASMPTARLGLGVTVASNGKIYAIGGIGNSTFLSTVEEYDPVTNTWTTKASMPTARGNLGVTTANNGKIYAVGGWNFSYLSTVEEYDPITDTWSTRASMPTARACLGVATANNGNIYAIGGTIGGGGMKRTVEEYDPVSDTWTTRANMPMARAYLGVATANNGKIYAIGGIAGDFSSTVEEYDPVKDMWTSKTNMPTARAYLGAAVINCKIYAIGGLNNDNWIATVEEYIPPKCYSEEINANSEWLDSTHFRTTYEFSVLNSRGDYQVKIEDTVGSDGIVITPDIRINFQVDYAGYISDVTIPETPIVSAWGDGSLTNLYAHWYSYDPESLITLYRYAIGTSPGGSDVVNWTNTTLTGLLKSGLTLTPDQVYYVSVKARNEGGLWSLAGYSYGIINGSNPCLYLPIIKK